MDNKQHDAIYLQKEDFEEMTWCADQINDDDVKYLLATPEREAAPRLHKMVKLFYEWLSGQYNPSALAVGSVMKGAKDILAHIKKGTNESD